MHFKYHEYLKGFPDCPPSSYKRKDVVAYRFVFEDLDENSFLPALVKKPKRVLINDSDSVRCQAHGLSLFDTLENAEEFYSNLPPNTSKNRHKTIGSHIAEGNIDKSDGVVSRVSSNGHFTLHESNNADLPSKFNIVKKIYNG